MVDLRGEKVVGADALHVLLDLLPVVLQELAPEGSNGQFVEEAQPLLVARFVENFVVDGPNLVVVGHHHVHVGFAEVLAAHYAVRADDQEDGHLDARLAGEFFGETKSSAEEQALAIDSLLADLPISLD